MFPRVISSNIHAKSLEQLKGVLHTLESASIDVLGERVGVVTLDPILQVQTSGDESKPTNKLTALKEKMEKTEVLCVTYKRITEKLLFLLVLPENSSSKLTQCEILVDLSEMLLFLFQSLDDIVSKEKHHHRLHVFFGNFFQKYFENGLQLFLSSFTKGYPYFQPNFDISRIISQELTTFESSLNKSDELITEHCRPCFIVGSCLFYRNVLICSHLNDEITRNIVRYITNIFKERKKDYPETIILEEVFCNTTKNPFDLLKKSTSNRKRERFVLVIFAQEESILCSLLDQRDKISGQRNPFYLDEMRVTLLNLKTKAFKLLDKQMKKSSLQSFKKKKQNILFHYIVSSKTCGTILFPFDISKDLNYIQNQFIHYCQIIREILHNQNNQVKEYGIHVQDQLGNGQTIGYWVVGFD